VKQNSLANPKTPSTQSSAVRQPQQEVRAAALAARGQVRDAARARQRLRDLLRGVDAPDLDEARAALLEGPTNNLGGRGLALGADDARLLFLFGLGNNISLALGLLLGDLLLLDGAAELLAEDEVRDGDIVQNNIEVVGALRERRADLGPVRLCVSV
jgi:hypothetical protein